LSRIRPLEPADRPWVEEFLRDRWGTPEAVARGRVYLPADLPGFAAFEDDRVVGLVTFELQGVDCEIVTIDALEQGRGIGTALVDAVADAARAAGCARLRLITTNDNLRALRFYQRRGFRLAALYPDALEVSRRLKPSISEVGQHGIPLRDELELVRDLTPPA
jgi:ribosomal protein S18 acetylase RimI-like enzyme